MRFDVLTLFPEMFVSPMEGSIIGRARQKGLLSLTLHQIRDWTTDKHNTADDNPFGGGGGMVMKPDVVVDAVRGVRAERGASWSLIYPQFTVAVPLPDVIRVPVAYAMPLGDQNMLAFMNRWLELKQKDGTRDDLFAYWFRGERDKQATRRWSVIGDVLGWVD